MHREIICAPDGIQVDHSNLDRLDNRRENLRLTLHRGNSANRPKRSGKYSSTFKGVHLDKRRGKWIVSVGKKFCGYFNSEIDAAKIYDQKSKEIFGEFSRPNNYQEEKPNV